MKKTNYMGVRVYTYGTPLPEDKYCPLCWEELDGRQSRLMVRAVRRGTDNVGYKLVCNVGHEFRCPPQH